MAVSPRVIVALPHAIESATIEGWLRTGLFEPVRLADPRSAAREMHARDFDLLVADAAFAIRDGLLKVSRLRNPSMPVVVIGNGTEADMRDPASRHAMYLERPVERATLICTVMMAIMEGRPTRRSERKIANRFEAIVNDVPSHIIDASYHGLQLHMPTRSMLALPPVFNVRVPLMGIAITVQRIWARSSPANGAPIILCGAALSANRPSAEQKWRGFVDMLPVVSAAAR